MNHEQKADSNLEEAVISVLIVEDDQKLAQLTANYLEKRGLVATIAADGPSGLSASKSHRYDVVLLDLLLPGRSGLEICREIRVRSDVPIIMVTALGDEGDRVVGLERGADDYIAKPFSSPELLARIRAIVRRSRGKLGPSTKALQVGRLSLDPGGLVAKLDGKILDLTAYEFALLYALAQRAGRVLTRDQLLDLSKGNPEEAFDRSIDGHISRLRKKLGDDPRQPRLIKTIRGAGYMFSQKEDS